MNPVGKLFIAAHVRLYRATHGRVGASMGGGRVLLLTTTGNKSGQPRTVPVMYFESDGKRVVVASNAGAASDPAWFKNLRQNPDVTVEVGDRRYRARARVVEGEERARIYRQVAAEASRFADYERRAGTRLIPVVELVEIGAA
jgi:deazaflavin-dependent oxidoreductase (nitroreductase family)